MKTDCVSLTLQIRRSMPDLFCEVTPSRGTVGRKMEDCLSSHAEARNSEGTGAVWLAVWIPRRIRCLKILAAQDYRSIRAEKSLGFISFFSRLIKNLHCPKSWATSRGFALWVTGWWLCQRRPAASGLRFQASLSF